MSKPQPHITIETLANGKDEICDFASKDSARQYGYGRRAQGAIIYVFESEMAVRLGLDPRRNQTKASTSRRNRIPHPKLIFWRR